LGQQAFLTQGAGRTGVPAAVVLALKLFRCSSNALTSLGSFTVDIFGSF
jgi:hypothetical protein